MTARVKGGEERREEKEEKGNRNHGSGSGQQPKQTKLNLS